MSDPHCCIVCPISRISFLVGGGYPCRVRGQIIGAIGVSGGHYSQDQQCLEAVLAA